MPLEAQGDLEVLVPVHPVGIALGPEVEHRQREVGIEVLRPVEDGHARTVGRVVQCQDRAR